MGQFGFESILILLGVAVVLVAIFRYLHLPQVLAYLSAGLLVGPYGLGWIPDLQGTRYLAEFGLVFLMFTIGLEFSLPQLMAMKRAVLGVGGAQVLLSFVVFGGVAWSLGIEPGGAIVVGGTLALSSTAVIMKLLVEQLEQHSRHGRAAFGVLLFQDLVVVPFLIVIPMLGGDTNGTAFLTLGWALIKSVVVLAAIILVGRVWLRPVLHEVARARSREFFMLAMLLITLAAAWITELAGLSLALGAFLAGLMLGETEYRHQVESDILPFRDVLLGLFFITVGMSLNLAVVRDMWPVLAVGLLLMLAFKIAIVFGVGRLFGLEPGVALRAGLTLAAGGEFGFALLIQAERYQVLADEPVQIMLALIVLSMLVAPLLIRYNGWLAKRVVPGYRERRESKLEAIRSVAGEVSDPVLICGYGRSGQNLAWMLREEGIESLGLDLDPVRVRDARDAGAHVVYGDAARRDVLLAAGLMQARALAISFTDSPAALRILQAVRELRPDMPVIVRTMDDRDMEQLKSAGATEVVPESLEGSLMMGSHLLLLMGVPVTHIVRQVQTVRNERYRMLRGFFHGAAGGDETEESYRERLHSVTLLPEAHAVGRPLSELSLHESRVTVTALRRAGALRPRPASDTLLESGDVLVLFGTPESLEHAEKLLLEG